MGTSLMKQRQIPSPGPMEESLAGTQCEDRGAAGGKLFGRGPQGAIRCQERLCHLHLRGFLNLH